LLTFNPEMKTNQFGEIILNQDDLCDLVMQDVDIGKMKSALVDHTVDLDRAALILEHVPDFIKYREDERGASLTLEDFDRCCQNTWKMPKEYLDFDIAQYVLSLCQNDAALQRAGQELLMFQERGLFNLLRYLKYLVDVMTQNRLIWGVGRGSSVSSYVLYLLGVHRVDSLYYDLDISEFLR